MGKPVYTADLMLGDVVVAASLAVQAWERSYDITIPPLHYPLGVTTDGVVLKRRCRDTPLACPASHRGGSR